MNKTIVFSDPDALNESRHVDLNESPLTMVWGRPSTGSIWFDQKGNCCCTVLFYSKPLNLLELDNQPGISKGNKHCLFFQLYCNV